MNDLSNIAPVDYVLLGHVTEDLQADGGVKLGGTASFSGLTALALGHKVGLLTSCSPSSDLLPLERMQINILPAEHTTTFRNIKTEHGRTQYMYHRASELKFDDIPKIWRTAPIIHLGPIASEINVNLNSFETSSLICLTPQGWLRRTTSESLVVYDHWSKLENLLKLSHATVLSIEDLDGDEKAIDEIASLCKILVITENDLGARVYWRGDVRNFPAPKVKVEEDTGAGDIFAACFFHRLLTSRDPWESARFAVELSALSVTRSYFDSIPTAHEIENAKIQVI